MVPSCLIWGLLAAAALLCQSPDRPRFTKDKVLPYRSYTPRLLTRGQFVSIYGSNLAPRKWCDEPHVQQEPFPPELCGVRVLTGGHPAGLMYVGPIGSPNMIYDQINFQIPADAPAEGIVPIQVCVGSVCSDLVEVEFTAQDIVLRLVGEAHVHMPIWIQVEIPMNLGFSYPHSTCPWDFGGYEFEIRRNGQLLAPKSKPECPHGPMRLVNISTSSKLPLHLVGQFDSPGAYEVRLTGPILAPDMTKVARFGQSDWMLFTVEAYSDEERVAWLREIAENADKPSGRHSAELIVSLLAWPDEKALATLIRFLPPPPTTPSSRRVSGNFSHVMYCLAPKSLAAFPEAVVRILMSTERLKQIRDAAMRCQ